MAGSGSADDKGSGCEDSDEKREHWFISNLLNRIEYVVIKRRKTKNFWMSYMVISLENPKTFGCFFGTTWMNKRLDMNIMIN